MYATELSINNPKNPVKPILIFTEPSKNKVSNNFPKPKIDHNAKKIKLTKIKSSIKIGL